MRTSVTPFLSVLLLPLCAEALDGPVRFDQIEEAIARRIRSLLRAPAPIQPRLMLDLESGK